MDRTKANKSNGVRDIDESLADCEAGEASGEDVLPCLEWDKDANLYQRLVRAQHDAKMIKSSGGGDGLKYKFLAHDDVTAEAKAVLTRHGILFFTTIDEMNRDERDPTNTVIKIRCFFINADKPDEKIEVMSQGYGLDKQDKGPGKAYSYAVKYALQKTLMFNTGEDIENHSIEYTPIEIAKKTEADIKGWAKSLFAQIENTKSYEQLKRIKTDNRAMLSSPAVPDTTKEAILEKLDAAIDDAKQVLLQDEAAE